MILDLFAGPGGWDVAMPGAIGIEHDASACATRAAAGHLTIRADVSTWPVPKVLTGLIGSPPCQTFSAAGNRDGIAHLGALMAHVRECVTGWRPFTGADARTTLVLEPLRFALEGVPEWIALEQVPDVLPIWEAYAYTLRALGWSVWTGILNSADFGVPQTRRRAILMAHRRKFPTPPTPTHCEGGAQTMFGELLPWVSMADALGWGFDERPCMTVSAGGTDTGGAEPLGRHCRTMLRHNQAERDRPKDEDGIRRVRKAEGGDYYLRFPACEPAPIITTQSDAWAWEMPATTIAGDSRITARCHQDEGSQGRDAKTTEQVRAGDYEGTEPIKLTVKDALILQSFPADYPVQGTKTKQFEQIGNAIPPRLARAILSAFPVESYQTGPT